MAELIVSAAQANIVRTLIEGRRDMAVLSAFYLLGELASEIAALAVLAMATKKAGAAPMNAEEMSSLLDQLIRGGLMQRGDQPVNANLN